MKLRTTKFSSEGLGGNSAKYYTSENFPLYGIWAQYNHMVKIVMIQIVLILYAWIHIQCTGGGDM